MKRFFKTLVNLFFSILLTILLIEIGLRLFPSVIPLDFLIYFNHQPRAEIAHRRGLLTLGWDTVALNRDDGGPELRIFRPFTKIVWPIEDDGTVNTVTMDENGFCNGPENSYQRPTIDIITLGDSFTVCHAVTPQETWTSKLADLSGYSTYNLGRVGVGIHEYLQIFKKFGLQKSPKMVIMNIYAGNDLRDAIKYSDYVNHTHRYESLLGSVPTSVDEALQYSDLSHQIIVDGFLARYSYSFNLARAVIRYWDRQNNPEAVANRKTNFRYKVVFSEDDVISFNPRNTDRDEVRHAKRLRDKYERINVDVYLTVTEALRTFVELAEQHNFVPIISYTPSAHTAYKAYTVFEDPTLHQLMPLMTQEQRTFLRNQADELGYVFVDLTPYLQEAAQSNGSSELLYYRYDLHLTPAGHTVVAEALNERLKELSFTEQQWRP